MKRRPPVVATWVLETLGSDPRNDQIVGDLVEQHSQGRSQIWYWRQVVAAVIIGLFRQINGHKFLAVRAVVTGWVAWYLVREAVAVGLSPTLVPLSMRLPVVVFFVWWIIWFLHCVICGSVVGRLHRANRIPMVLIFSFTVFLYEAGVIQWPALSVAGVIQWLPQINVPFVRTGINALRDSRYVPALLAPLVGSILGPMFVLLGGLSGATGNKRKVIQWDGPPPRL